jgi:hypothetical protein
VEQKKYILELLDWIVAVMERLLVLGLAFLVFYFGYQLLHGNSTQGQLDVLKALSENWKAGLVLLIALFYGTARKFLEEVQEIWGMKRKLKGTKEEEKPILNQGASS